jgi:hypothetical protein
VFPCTKAEPTVYRRQNGRYEEGIQELKTARSLDKDGVALNNANDPLQVGPYRGPLPHM